MVIGQNEPADRASSLILVEMARIPAGRIAASTPPVPGSISLETVIGSLAMIGER